MENYQANGRYFPTEYYAKYETNRIKRKGRWFVNRMPSPPIQNQIVTSSEDSAENIEVSDHLETSTEDATNNDLDFELDNRSEEENHLENSSLDNPNKDPDFQLETSEDQVTSDSEDDQDYESDHCLKKPQSRLQKINLMSGSSTSASTSFPNQEYCCSPSAPSSASLSVDNFMKARLKLNGEERKGKKGKDFCFYCETLVLNFARHIVRMHSIEIEVQKIMLLPTRSKERKNSLTLLRKKGNYLVSSIHPKAMKKSACNENLLSCPSCYGYYSSKQLWRHKKYCDKKINKSDSQNFFLKNLRIDPLLRDSVFPRMRPDTISLVAKKDLLICAFATRYIKVHREKHCINVATRKMRELAKLLIEIKKINPTTQHLADALKPTMFDSLVSATKIVAKYDSEKECFGIPSYALHIGTTLKQCCEIAILQALKKKDSYADVNAAETEADIKTLIQLIDSHWRFEISSQAATDLNTNKYNKVTVVPLATDLKILKNYLIVEAERAVQTLETKNEDTTAYGTLLETVFCRVLLLNRRRPGELQRLPLHLYEKYENNPQNYEEFSQAVTPSETILMKKFKRIVIRGKRDRGVPVLFSPDVQIHINILRKYRDNFINTKNLYLFANPYTIGPICGYKTMRKYATKCGAKNPNALTATRLRKHLATLTQLLSMSDNDIEQLATFMGHTVSVHKGSYRLPDDVYQTSKISKLLLLMEKGEAAQYKGKSLNEIHLDLEEDLMQEDENEKENNKKDELEIFDGINEITNETDTGNLSKINANDNIILNKNLKKTRTLIPWTDEQKKVVYKYFADHIKQKIPPKKNECDVLKSLHENLFKNKDWLKIKVYVQNIYTKKSKKSKLLNIEL